MTKRITLKAAKAMTEQWFSIEWTKTFNSYLSDPDPKRLEDLLFATRQAWKGVGIHEGHALPSGNHGSIYEVFDQYRSGADFLNDMLIEVGHDEFVWRYATEDEVARGWSSIDTSTD